MATNRPLTHVEQVAGKRAPFIVYYRRNGKLYHDAMWAAGSDEAADKLKKIARELGWRVEIVRVERRDPPAA